MSVEPIPPVVPAFIIDAPPGPPYLEQATRLSRTREILAFLLFGLFAVSVLASLAYVGSEESWRRAKEFLQIAVPAELGLLGAAVGFYFGSESAGLPDNG